MSPDWSGHARRALAEDEAASDVTTSLITGASDRTVSGRLIAEEDLVIAGTPIIDAVFDALDVPFEYAASGADGEQLRAPALIGTIQTKARAMLAGERVILNYLQRLSAVATRTRAAVDAVAGTNAVITDTRKTTPGLRDVEKYAVRMGGGINHRTSLRDAVLFKDNHWELLAGGNVAFSDLVAAAPEGIPFQVEVETVEQLEAVVAAGVTMVLVDNQLPETLRQWKARAGPGVTIEASGGISVEDVGPYARAGADRISMGSLTHSAGSVSIRLDLTID